MSAGGTRVRRERDGTFFVRPYLGTDSRGRQVRPYHAFPGVTDEAEAQALADTWMASLAADGTARSSLLRDLLEDYVDMRERNGASPNTVRTWRLFSSYVARWLPHLRAADATVAGMTAFEQRLLEPEPRGQGLSRTTVSDVHAFLRVAFSHLAKAGVVASNPMVSVEKPRPERHEAVAVDEWDFPALERALSDAMAPQAADDASARDATFALAAWLALRTGMRCGEVCALRRRDVWAQRLQVHVGGTVIEQRGRAPWRRDVTKGRRSRNVSVTEADVRTIAAVEALQDRVWGRRGPSAPLVSADGSWARPTNVSHEFGRLRDRLGMPREVTFHSLRHTHATWCLANGVDLKTLSARLGHADEATTLRVYAHVMPGADAQAAEAFARAAERASGGVAGPWQPGARDGPAGAGSTGSSRGHPDPSAGGPGTDKE